MGAVRAGFPLETTMEEGLLTIGEFSRLSGIKRKTLIFYDREGIFSPSRVGSNGYRYYSPKQLQVATAIVALREIGVSLDAIGAFLRVRTPRRLINLCVGQRRQIEAESKKLERIGQVIESLQTVTESAIAVKTGATAEMELPAARLFAGPAIESDAMDAIDSALVSFHELCGKMDIPQTYPLGAITGVRGAGPKSVARPVRFYRPAKETVPDALIMVRPAGRYLVGYGRGDYGMLDWLYRKLLRLAKRRRLEVAEEAFEEYALDEMAVRNPDLYMTRVALRIV